MALKDKWIDKINGVDINSADDINMVAHAIIELEENGAVDGENGATFTPSVSDTGVISWTNDKGLPNPSSVSIKGPEGDPGKDGKSAYAYAKDGGFTGTESEFADRLARDIPTELPNPYPLTINGQEYDGSEAVDITFTGGGASLNTSLGTTPVTLTGDASVKLVGDGEHTYTVKGKTVADLSSSEMTTTAVTVTDRGEYYEITGTGSAWTASHADIAIGGLTAGVEYVLNVKAMGASLASKIGSSYFVIRTPGGTQLAAQLCDTAKLFSISFTPDSSSVNVIWYPANNYYWSNDCKTSKIEDLYVNLASDGTVRTTVINKTDSFTGSVSLGQLSKGITITASPACEVFSVTGGGEDAGGALPLVGKTVVCFGDSLFGMHTGETSAPAFVAAKTGAAVYNVGFGGCRMSVHPYVGYNEFCMYALADAIASGDFSVQDAAVSSGSANFPEQLEVLKGIDFDTVDIIVIHYGTNDFGAGNAVAIDNTSNPKDINTLCGALRYSIETLLAKYPKLRIFVSVPCFRYWTQDNGTIVYSDTKTNGNGKKLTDFVSALKDAAREYNLPVIDSYYGLGINKVNADTYLEDGTHHNADGRKRFGEFIGASIISENVVNGTKGEKGDKGDKGDTGATGASGADGKDYVLTEADKAEIAEQAAGLVDMPEGGGGIVYVEVADDGSGGYTASHTFAEISSLISGGENVVVRYNNYIYIPVQYTASMCRFGNTSQPSNTQQWLRQFQVTKTDAWSFREYNLALSGGGGSGGASIDVTAAAGQTIRVKEVDANGKPTAWEAVDYQPKICGEEFQELMPSTQVTPYYDETAGAPMADLSDFDVVAGNTYRVTFDGVEYVCEAFVATLSGLTAPAFGNRAIIGEANTGEPFGIFKIGANPWTNIILFDMNAHTVRVEVEKPIPLKYVSSAFPYLVDIGVTSVSSSGVTQGLTCSETLSNLLDVYYSGRPIAARMFYYDNNSNLIDVRLQFRGMLVSAVTGQTLFQFSAAESDGATMLFLLSQDDGTFEVKDSLT